MTHRDGHDVVPERFSINDNGEFSDHPQRHMMAKLFGHNLVKVSQHRLGWLLAPLDFEFEDGAIVFRCTRRYP